MSLGADGFAAQLDHAAEARADGGGLLAGTARLLAEGGDQRIRLEGAAQTNRYGCATHPDDALLAFGSSTASTISDHAYAAADALRDRLGWTLNRAAPGAVYEQELERIRGELLGLWGLEQAGVEVLMSPSGTDLHMLAAQLVGSDPSRPTLAIISEEAETGSGVSAALQGRRYSATAPLGDVSEHGVFVAGGPAAETVNVPARDADGRPRDPDAVDAEVEAMAAGAASSGRRVLLVVTDVSKTGLITPSPALARRLSRLHPDQITVLVDGCQTRLSPRTLQAYLREGWLVAVTGSKFLTGPAFSGALLVPSQMSQTLARRVLPARLRAWTARAEWPQGWTARAQLQPAVNLGLLLRWEAALAELRRFRALPEPSVRAFVGQFAKTADAAVAAHPAFDALEGRPLERGPGVGGDWDDLATIFPFRLRRLEPYGAFPWLSLEETAQVHRLVREDLSALAVCSADPQVRAASSRRVELGQPVTAGVRDGVPVTALRLCLGARQIAEACAGGPEAAAAVIQNARLALAKIAWAARLVQSGTI